MRKRIFSLILSCVVLCVCAFGTFAVAYAEVPTGPVNYMDLDYTVKEGAAYNQVTVPIPEECLYLGIYNQSTTSNVVALRGKSFITYAVDPGFVYTLRVYPFSVYGLLLDNIPEGTMLNFTLRVDVEGTENFYIPSLYKDYYYNNSSGTRIGNVIMSQIDGTVGNVVNVSYELRAFPDGAYSFVPYFRYVNFGTALDGSARYTFTVSDVSLTMNISNGYWEQWLAEHNGQMIDDLGDRLEGAINDSTNEIQGSLGDINGSLGDLNDKVDTLPEDIGDQMQGVIDKENDKAESSGNKFVNQILDKLPDPSTEVLGSLKALTDSMAYTGTDCKLKIPALVIPEIDGLIPEMEIWGGAEFSFSDYLSFLPPALLTVVQSLFTIAIVLFCVYELKGIISYCLTLNDKKGG